MQASPSHPDSQLIAVLQRLAAGAAVLTGLVGALALAGWALNNAVLKSFGPGLASMKPLTALGLLLGAAALWLTREQAAGGWQRRLGLFLAGMMGAIGGLILLEYLLGLNLGLDQVLFPQAVIAENTLPVGRPSPVTAACLLLLGLGLLWLDARPAWLAPAATLMALLVGGLALLGYIYQVTTLYQFGPFAAIALHTALAIILLSLGLLAARPEGSIVGVLTTHLAGSVLGRRLLLAVVVVPVVLGWLRLYGQRLGLYDTGFGVSLLVSGNVLVFASLVYAGARLLNKADANREAVHTELREREERLRSVADATPNGLITVTAAGMIEWSNRRAESLFGYGPGQLVGRRMEEMAPGWLQGIGGAQRPERQAVADPRAGAMEAGRGLHGVRPDGTEFPVDIGLSPLHSLKDKLTLASVVDITERKNSETALRLSEERFAKAFRASPAALTVTRVADGLFIDVNEQYLRLLGYERDEVIGHTATGLNMYPDPAMRAELVRRLRADGTVRNFEMDLLTKTGERRTVLFSTEEIEVSGEAHILATLIEISERKRAEEALRQLNAELETRVQQRTADLAANEAKFRTLFNVLPVGVSILDDKQRVVDSNASLARIIKMSTEGRAAGAYASRKYIRPDGTPLQPHELASARVLHEQRPVLNVEMGIVDETGETVWVDVSATPLPVAGFTAVVVTTDLTERKRIEQALALERDQLQALMDSVPDTIYFKDRASRFTRVNPAQARMLGVATPELAVGKTDADFQPTELAADFYAEEQRLLASGQPLLDRVEFNPTPSGEPRWLSSTKVPLKDASGEVVGLVGISRDITGRMKAEEELHRLNQQLADRVRELSGLNKLDEQLQACLTIEGTYQLTADLMSQFSPAQVGALYTVNADRTLVTRAASWGAAGAEPQVFGLDDCWALKRGQLYLLDESHHGLPCRHLNGEVPMASVCLPLIAQDQALGVLHMRATDAASAQTFEESAQQMAHFVADSLALTWANLMLRETLRQQALRDPLTGLFNRRFMEESLVRELHRAGRDHQTVSLIMMDVDHFKQVNDRFGHETGDAALRALADLLQACSRGSDIPCRYGGEEFLLILPEASIEIARQRAETLRDSFRQMKFGIASNPSGPITLSLGVASYPQHGPSMEAVLRAADTALYRAKDEGRDQTCVAPG